MTGTIPCIKLSNNDDKTLMTGTKPYIKPSNNDSDKTLSCAES